MEEDSIPDQAPFIDFVWMSSELWFLSGFIGIKNETLRIQLVSLYFGYANVSGYVSLQRMAAGLSTHVFLFCLLQWLSRLNVLGPLALSLPFSPLLSSSSMFLAALTSQFQKIAFHRLLVQRKTFRVHLSTIFMLASLGFRNFHISSLSFAFFLDGCSFPRMSTSEFTRGPGRPRRSQSGSSASMSSKRSCVGSQS
jgi:hypothetical protein